eukprot:gene8606-8787_t
MIIFKTEPKQPVLPGPDGPVDITVELQHLLVLHLCCAISQIESHNYNNVVKGAEARAQLSAFVGSPVFPGGPPPPSAGDGGPPGRRLMHALLDDWLAQQLSRPECCGLTLQAIKSKPALAAAYKDMMKGQFFIEETLMVASTQDSPRQVQLLLYILYRLDPGTYADTMKLWKTYAASTPPPTTAAARAPDYWADALSSLVDGSTPSDMLADMLRLSPMTEQIAAACGSSNGWMAFINLRGPEYYGDDIYTWLQGQAGGAHSAASLGLLTGQKPQPLLSEEDKRAIALSRLLEERLGPTFGWPAGGRRG